jgi:hypothetical protein
MLLLLLACAGPDPKPADDTAAADDTGPPDTIDTSEESPDPDTVPLGGSCPLDQDYGGFVVSAGETSTTVDGAVTDGVVPFTVLEEIARDGDCAILRRNNPYCDPGCDPGYTCAFDGTAWTSASPETPGTSPSRYPCGASRTARRSS